MPRQPWHLVAARLVGGTGIGIASMLSPLYIAEISPARRRGGLIAVYQLAITIGILVAYLSNYGLAEMARLHPEFYGSGVWRVVFVDEVWRGMLLAGLVAGGRVVWAAAVRAGKPALADQTRAVRRGFGDSHPRQRARGGPAGTGRDRGGRRPGKRLDQAVVPSRDAAGLVDRHRTAFLLADQRGQRHRLLRADGAENRRAGPQRRRSTGKSSSAWSPRLPRWRPF